ncbi:metallophosphoesterase family protein [Longimicrobium sp.]|uniref:metallophosphoesterase family protein n=1 Tax=Longimicrobium sp. TaxID=2029185 RepID=UPI002BAFD26F|nr:metallophosphoesterase [Longimicrobium sp.]HSU12764.1 metallophosphoesterase [Longimicrobium sp.]
MTDGAKPAEPGSDRRGGRRRDDRRRSGIVRIAAVGDFHCGEEDAGRYREAFARANDEADVLLLAGDLTRRGTPAEFRVVAGELAEVRIPILAVLGNHDHESGEAEAGLAILRERGVHILDGEPFELDRRIGFAGVKGFIGGFGRWTLTSFGEHETKQIVAATLEEVSRLEFALRRLSTPQRVVLLHYAPICDTVIGEPEQIFPFLGNDRLVEPIDRFKAAAVFHGHAHHGTFRGRTPGGVPVFNVSHVLLKNEGVGEMYYLFDVPLENAGAPVEEPEAAAASA